MPGSEPSGSGEAGRVEVPDVLERGVVKAVQILAKAGLERGAIKRVANRKQTGTVVGTKPSAGSAVKPGTRWAS